MCHIKQETWIGGVKLIGVNYRRLIDQNKVIINNIRDIFIELNKDAISGENINMYCDKHTQISNEMDHAHRCMRLLNIMDELI